MSQRAETPETCTHAITEPCLLHPVDCSNCENGPTCQARPIMEAHPETIKRCRFFRRRKQ